MNQNTNDPTGTLAAPKMPRHMPALHLGNPTTVGPLTVFPVWTGARLSGNRYYRTPARGGAIVEELDSGAKVGQVQVRHVNKHPMVLLEGSLLEAGWQHRVLLHDVAVADEHTEIVDVACVEHGRWGSADAAQRTGNRRAPLAVRGAAFGLRREHSAAFAPGHERLADQGDVWRRVSRYERRHGASATSSLVEVSARLDRQVARLVRRVAPLPGQRGVLIGIGGHPALLEVFDHPETLVENWEGILGSVWMDARGTTQEATPGYRARAFVRRISRSPIRPVRRAGAGTGVLTEDLSLFTGRGLILGPSLVHAAVLNTRHDLVLAA